MNAAISAAMESQMLFHGKGAGMWCSCTWSAVSGTCMVFAMMGDSGSGVPSAFQRLLTSLQCLRPRHPSQDSTACGTLAEISSQAFLLPAIGFMLKFRWLGKQKPVLAITEKKLICRCLQNEQLTKTFTCTCTPNFVTHYQGP